MSNPYDYIHPLHYGGEGFEKLKKLGAGSHKFKGGWMHVRDKEYDSCGEVMGVMYTTSKNTHYGTTKAYDVEYMSDGRIQFVCKSAISMWPVRERKDRKRIAMLMESRIDKVFEWKEEQKLIEKHGVIKYNFMKLFKKF